MLVHTDAHGLGALTGPDGHWFDTYLAEFFFHPEAHRVTPADLDEDWL